MNHQQILIIDKDEELDYQHPEKRLSITFSGESVRGVDYSFQCGIFWRHDNFALGCELVRNNEDDSTLIWHRLEQIPHQLNEDPDFMHTQLRAFLLDCGDDLFLIGFHLVGHYVYERQGWNVQRIDKTEPIDLPNDFMEAE